MGTVYYYRLRSYNEYGKSDWSSVIAKTNSFPKIPYNPNPSNGATNVSLNPTLSWDASDPDGDVLTYSLYLSTNKDDLELKAENIANSSYQLNGLKGHTTYYWKVVAKDGHGAVTEGNIWSFTTLNRIPTAPSNIEPSNGATNVSLSPTLSWDISNDPDGDIVTYDIYLSKNLMDAQYNVPTALIEQNITPDSSNIFSYTIQKQLENGGVYYWKIVAKDKYGGTNQSTIWSFTTDRIIQYFQTNGPIYSSPALGTDGTIYIGSDDGCLYAINQDGSLKWKYNTYHKIRTAPAIANDGTIYIASYETSSDAINFVYAINPNGTLKWKTIMPKTSPVNPSGAVRAAPSIGRDGTIYINSVNSYTYALDPITGNIKWGSIDANNQGELVGSASVKFASDNDQYESVYAASITGHLFVWNSHDGSEKADLNASIYSTSPPLYFVVPGDNYSVYFGGFGGALFKMDSRTNSVVWGKYAFKYIYDDIYSEIVIGSNGNIYATKGKYLVSMDAGTGNENWQYDCPSQDNEYIKSSPLIGDDGTIYVVKPSGMLYAITDNSTPVLKWSYKIANIDASSGWGSYHYPLPSPVMTENGVLCIGLLDGRVYFIKTSSNGLDNGPWPMFRHDPQHRGR